MVIIERGDIVVKFGKWVARHRIVILIIGVLLLIPSAIGMIKTRINYDILSYLPEDIETMKGQDVLMDEFGKGGFSMVMIQGMSDKDVAATKKKIEAVDHVADVVWYDTIADISIPKEVLPDDLYEFFNSGDSTLMAVFFDDTTAGDGTLNAIEEIRKITDKQCFVSGMSAVNLDIKNLSNEESVMYVVIAVLLVSIVLAVTMESFLMPVFMMISIGMAILYNMGTNIFLGEISFITKALSAVLQLGVTMDFSIFLWHSYQENQERFPGDKNRAMGHAISNTITSVVGSSLTTVAGFLALCFMSFTLGLDLGVVMAKGVVLGVIGCVTILPSLILTFDKALEKTMHREIMPNFDKPARWIVNHSWIFLIIFVLLLGPAIYGYNNTKVYYDLSDTLPEKLNCSQANKLLADNFDGTNSIYMILADSNLSAEDSNAMMNEVNDLDGISFALSIDSALGGEIPTEMLPDSLVSELKGDEYQIMMVSTNYTIASDEINDQINKVDAIAKKYDAKSMVIGEAPCTKDLITITDKDFKTVSAVSIVAIFFIIFFVLKSISLPVILVAAIEFAIFVNMGIPYYTGTTIPFISSVVIGTIQLGATVDYAILMTTRYKRERAAGNSKKESISIALGTSIPSIIVSALGFFAATFGVGMIASVDMIASLCTLMARGAIISMFVVIFVLPSLFVLLDKVIIHTSLGFKPKKNSQN